VVIGNGTARVVELGRHVGTGRDDDAAGLRRDVMLGVRTGRVDELVHERVELLERHRARRDDELFLGVGVRT
jgi:hypothetical protein